MSLTAFRTLGRSGLIVITPEQFQTLNESSALDPAFPYGIFTGEVKRMIFGGAIVQGWR